MIKGLTLTVVIENTASMEKSSLLAQHGLSLLLEIDFVNSDKVTVLMDTGPSPETTLHNVGAMGVDLSMVDIVFLSHGHYDHTGGLIGVLKRLGKKVPVIAHPSVFEPKLKSEPHLKSIGSPCTLSEVEAAGGIMLCAKNTINLGKGVMTSGQIERSTTFEKTQGFQTIKEGLFIEDYLPDDQALIVHIEGKGLAVISGCAHSGIINTLRHAQKIASVNDIYAVIGGFHLEKANDEQIKSTIDELKRLSPKIIAPCHCTGLKAINHLINSFGNQCKPLRTGDILKL